MTDKMTAAIERLDINAPTFDNVEITPTLINFFFGKNGVGKSTIAKAISDNAGVTWKAGKSVSDYSVLLYNQAFIDRNLEQYGNMPGVFMVNEENIETKHQIDELKEKQTEQDELVHKAGEQLAKRNEEGNALRKKYEQKFWDEVKYVRDNLGKAVSGVWRSKSSFFDAAIKNQLIGNHDTKELEELFELAFGGDDKPYSPLHTVSADSIPFCELLGQSIVSRSNTPFSEFISALNATNWVRQGHELYGHKADGRCPYCQQPLPDDFEDNLAACFDRQYQEKINVISAFLERYKNAGNEIWRILSDNKNSQFPKIDFEESYQNLMDVFMAVFQNNINKIKDKLEHPEAIIELEDVSGTLAKLSEIIANFNKQIEEYNTAIREKQTTQEKLHDQVWEYMGYLLQNSKILYQENLVRIENEKKQCQKDKEEAHALSVKYQEEITSLGSVGVETTTAIKGINNLLQDSGFQGFMMREKPGVDHVYEVVRDDGKGHIEIAQNLSEGEKNFIAFLYFYETVKGSIQVADASKDKIVVIDDPVSSMDSSALFLVASMVQEMMEICRNNGVCVGNPDAEKYIKQMFILTHNVYFHQQLTYNQIKNYEYVTLFLITKEDNRSAVMPCTKEENRRMVNYSPVQNTYTALWQEYSMTNKTIPLMNVIRRILDYYFIQLCGFEGHELKKRILEDEETKKNFRHIRPDGTVDTIQYQQARAMLAYIDSNTEGISDGLHYVYCDMDPEQCKKTFELIFRCMEQGQHYDMMMKSV